MFLVELPFVYFPFGIFSHDYSMNSSRHTRCQVHMRTRASIRPPAAILDP
jgi:hypothetical protein